LKERDKVLKVPEKGFFLCFSVDVGWYFNYFGKVVILDDSKSFMPLVSILDNSFEDFLKLLMAGVAKAGSVNFIPEFPFGLFLSCAITWNNYWCSKALLWLEQGALVDGNVRVALCAVLEDKRFSQANRQHALQVLRKNEML